MIPGRSNHRHPYVGDGADGARRSAEIDRSEADLVPTENEAARARLLASAARWEAQAAELDAKADAEEHRRVTRRADAELRRALSQARAAAGSRAVVLPISVARDIVAHLRGELEDFTRTADQLVDIISSAYPDQLHPLTTTTTTEETTP